MKNIWYFILTTFLIISLVANLYLVVYINWYLKFVGTSHDIIRTVKWDIKWKGQFHWNILDSNLQKSYENLSRKLGWKYYYDNSSKTKIIIKNVYYFDGQNVKAVVTFLDGTKKTFNKVKFESIVAKKDYIKQVEIFVINWKPLAWTIIFKWDELWTNKDDSVTLLE